MGNRTLRARAAPAASIISGPLLSIILTTLVLVTHGGASDARAAGSQGYSDHRFSANRPKLVASPPNYVDALIDYIKTEKHSAEEVRKTIVEHSLYSCINARHNDSGEVPLRVAIEHGKLQYVKVLVELGADVNVNDGKGSVLDAAVWSKEPESVAILRFLLQRGAVVAPETEDQLSARTPLGVYSSAKLHLIHRTRQCFGYQRERVEALGLGNLHALTLSVVGQPLALRWLVRCLMSQVLRQRHPRHSKPLVLVFGGAPGHGKTEVAMLMSQLSLGHANKPQKRQGQQAAPSRLPFLKVRCNTCRHVGDLLGHASTFVGSDRDTPLNRFLRQHNAAPSLVLLDEADKMEGDCWVALMSIFERGEWNGRAADDDLGGGVLTEVVDCRKTIFILTSNFLDHEISRFERLNAERVAEAARLAEQGEDNEVLAGLMDDFQAFIRPRFTEHFPATLGPAISRRVDGYVPFFGFSDHEAYVFTELAFASRAAQLKRPQGQEYPLGNIRLSPTIPALLTLSHTYREAAQCGGATVITRAVDEAVLAGLADLYALGKIDTPVELHVSRQEVQVGMAIQTADRCRPMAEGRPRVVLSKDRPPVEHGPQLPPQPGAGLRPPMGAAEDQEEEDGAMPKPAPFLGSVRPARARDDTGSQ